MLDVHWRVLGHGGIVVVLAKVALRISGPYCIVLGIVHVPWGVEHSESQLKRGFCLFLYEISVLNFNFDLKGVQRVGELFYIFGRF